MTEGPDPSRKTTVRFSIVYLIKAYLGPGCLGLPYAMKQAGLVGKAQDGTWAISNGPSLKDMEN